MACIDLHAMACMLGVMEQNLLTEVREAMALLGVKEHRFGILAAGNGRLVERLEENRRIWPETEERVRQFIARVRQERGAT